ncbi:cation/H(+) antiporter 15-like [Telopea speciosissima]|uniref:cation/H(+) antiporter 15-like n=1 Tax=Telopea speciosissima TaxID=54955 RepID=UPI001CC76FAC|nr:cation/H(+) antiporter 15-like [Telopea speciosissima]
MDSRMMEPEEFWAFEDYLGNSTRGLTCLSNRTSSSGIIQGDYPLGYFVPLLVLQMSLASITILFTLIILKPLGQPLMVAQILGGVLLGPSALAHSKTIARLLFPLQSFIMLDVIAVLGIMFYFFLIGVYMDPWIVKRIGQKGYAIGISAGICSILSPLFGFYYVYDSLTDQSLKESIPYVMRAQTIFTFPIIARYLFELNILNSEFGGMALSSSIVGGMCSVLYQLWGNNGHSISFLAILRAIGFILGIIFIIRPLALLIIKRNKEGASASIYSIFVAVLVSGLGSHWMGYPIILGPFVLGIAIPPGPPLGAALVKRLEVIVSWILMPIYFLKIGLAINIFSIPISNLLNVGMIILIACFGKFLGAFAAAIKCKLPLSDALSVALIVNVKGALELAIVKATRRKEQLNNECFMMVCTSMLVTTMVITFLLKVSYDPSKRYLVYSRRTIMDSKPNIELRLLMCIHKEESVPSLINILEASHHTQYDPISVYILHLVELVGRATPLFISHNSLMYTSSKAKLSAHIVNAFRQYEGKNEVSITVNAFTAVTPVSAMYDDVCMFALEKRTSLIILPFHEQRATRGSMSETARLGYRSMNLRVLEKAPCSVAILIERGLWRDSWSALASWSPFRVAVLFFGGPDDREALAFATRLSGHPKVSLLVIRILPNHDGIYETEENLDLDDHIINEFRYKKADNDRIRYIEERVKDGTGSLRVIQSLESDDYQLVMVGRLHDNNSPVMSGLAEWSELTELGTIGDILTSSDFRSDAMILVIQQHAKTTKVSKKNWK